MSDSKQGLIRLYLAVTALLVAHEIDSAFWKEWDLFGIPGGVQVFVLLNLVLIAVILWGFERLIIGKRSGLWMSLVTAAAGLAALGIHSTFLVMGRTEFKLPVSLGVLAATGIASVWLAVLAVRAIRNFRKQKH
jgi:hypothetical protein